MKWKGKIAIFYKKRQKIQKPGNPGF